MTEVLVKSEKLSQKKKKVIVWAIAVLLAAVTIVSFVIDYSGYKKGQEFGLMSAIAAGEIGGASWVNKNDSYSEQCEDAYYHLSKTSYDITLNGVRYDASEARKAERALRSAFYDAMKAGGFDRYSSSSIADWFKYANAAEYFTGYYLTNPLVYCLCIYLLFSIIFTLLINRAEKKELLVYEDSVLCRFSSRKSKQLVFEDINNVDFGKNMLKLAGTGFKFKITNIANAESIKSIIIDKKKSEQIKSQNTVTGSADELKKYKELLDCGVISQEEFDAKKKQILGL